MFQKMKKDEARFVRCDKLFILRVKLFYKWTYKMQKISGYLFTCEWTSSCWMSSNQLLSAFIHFRNRNKIINENRRIVLGVDELKNPDCITQLGTQLEKNTFNESSNRTNTKKIVPMVGILYKIRHYTSKSVLMTIFHAHI